VSLAKHGFLYQGQYYSWQKKRRGTASHDVAPERLVCYLQNHDQLANSQRGERVWSRPLTALLLLQPQTPMLFQGQEFGARTPFLYFADHKPELAKLVRKGRADFLGQFPSIDRNALAAPDDRATFESCKLDHTQRDEETLRMHRELIALRRERPFVEQRSDWLFGAILGEQCFALRWLTGGNDDRLLLVNLGEAFEYAPVAEPLLAPPEGFTRWVVMWGAETFEEWRIHAGSALVLAPATA
jgi:maltooligosyltrehalose trehalohydrolase